MPYMVHLEIESASVADGVSMLVSSPKRRHVCLTVGTRRARSARRRLQEHKLQSVLSERLNKQKNTHMNFSVTVENHSTKFDYLNILKDNEQSSIF